MGKTFEVGKKASRLGLENDILEIIKPTHKECGGTVVIGQSSPGDNGDFKIVCNKCGERAVMNRKQRLAIIIALLRGHAREINEKIRVVSESGE
ncbi:MAG: hypothetical protein E4H47_01190 [Parcubacteria group bacterium]|nr:MAG: hypothetical protein E4H47_01190 [Parcubacteria group bacterium]